MKNSTKVIILSILGIVSMVLVIAINSVWVSAGVIVALVGTAIAMIYSSSSDFEKLSQHLSDFEEF